MLKEFPKIPDLTIKEELGTGGYGTVYKSFCLNQKKLVAAKIVLRKGNIISINAET
jgi:serine/threonine protein kinase